MQRLYCRPEQYPRHVGIAKKSIRAQLGDTGDHAGLFTRASPRLADRALSDQELRLGRVARCQNGVHAAHGEDIGGVGIENARAER